jgi:hypothetical protein
MEERPKSPWTPSYSVTTQGSASEPAELDQLDQLPPSLFGAVEQHTKGAIDEVIATEPSELVAVEASMDLHHHDDVTRIQPGVSAIDSTAVETLASAPTDTTTSQDNVKPVLAGSSLSEDDIMPQASCNTGHGYYYLTLLSVFHAADCGHFVSEVGRRRLQPEISMDAFVFCHKSR